MSHDACFGLHLPRPICLETFLYTRLFRDSDTHFGGLDYRLWFDGICTVEHRTLFYSASVCLDPWITGIIIVGLVTSKVYPRQTFISACNIVAPSAIWIIVDRQARSSGKNRKGICQKSLGSRCFSCSITVTFFTF